MPGKFIGAVVYAVTVLFVTALGLGSLGIAAAAWWKASKDMAVIRNGFSRDYATLSIVMAVVGLVLLGGATWMAIRRLRRKPLPQDSHF